jgi:hypothetical protein
MLYPCMDLQASMPQKVYFFTHIFISPFCYLSQYAILHEVFVWIKSKEAVPKTEVLEQSQLFSLFSEYCNGPMSKMYDSLRLTRNNDIWRWT